MLAAAIASGWWAWTRVSPPPTGRGSHPAERMNMDDAFATGLRLGNAGSHLASLPYFERALTLNPDSWGHENYANALYNGAHEVRDHLGKLEPATRSSVERVGMIVESLREADVASSLASSSTDRALFRYQRAQALYTLGLVLDAWIGFREARALDPGSGRILRGMNDAETQLRSGGLSK